MYKSTLFAITIIISLSGCNTLQVFDISGGNLVSLYDFRPYTEKGFMFYPHENKTENFETMGMIRIEALPIVKRIACADDQNMISNYESKGYEYHHILLIQS